MDIQNFDTAEQMVYTYADACFAYLEQHGETAADGMSDEQHTLMAYVYLDSQVQEGGFVQLIASGYGEYVLLNPLADSLRRWRIKQTPKILEQAKKYYQEVGEDIETATDEGISVVTLRKQYPQFEELDAAYYDCVEEDMALAATYIKNHPKYFVLPKTQS